MTVLIVIAFVIATIVWYAMRGRAWLKSTTWGAKFLAWIEPLETALYQKSETLLVGRLTWLSGLVVTAYDGVATFATGLNLTPLTDRIFAPVPADLRPLAVTASVTGLGLLIVGLRKRVTKPLPLVAAPSTSAAAQAANIQVEQANAEAVATVEAAKAA